MNVTAIDGERELFGAAAEDFDRAVAALLAERFDRHLPRDLSNSLFQLRGCSCSSGANGDNGVAAPMCRSSRAVCVLSRQLDVMEPRAQRADRMVPRESSSSAS